MHKKILSNTYNNNKKYKNISYLFEYILKNDNNNNVYIFKKYYMITLIHIYIYNIYNYYLKYITIIYIYINDPSKNIFIITLLLLC